MGSPESEAPPPARPQMTWFSDAVMQSVSHEGEALQDELADFIRASVHSPEWTTGFSGGSVDGSPMASPPPARVTREMSVGARGASAPAECAGPTPLSREGFSPAAGVLQRLRRNHTFSGGSLAPAEAPAEAPPSVAPPAGGATRALKRSVDHLAATGATAVPQQPAQGSFMADLCADGMLVEAALPAVPRAPIRRSASMPSKVDHHAPPVAQEQLSMLIQPSHSAESSEYYSGGVTPMWALKRAPGGPPLLDARGVPTWVVPSAPPLAAQQASRYSGVSRAPWSTRWDAHASRPDGSPVYVGSYDSEERAARAHDVGTLRLRGAQGATAGLCNFALGEYAGVEELQEMPEGEFIAALRASAMEPPERRYSKYRGVYPPRDAAKGDPERWEGRLEEAPDSAAAGAQAGSA